MMTLTPLLLVQDEIFKMSDLSLNISTSNLQAMKSTEHGDETRRPPRVPSSLFKKIEKIGKYGKVVSTHFLPLYGIPLTQDFRTGCCFDLSQISHELSKCMK